MLKVATKTEINSGLDEQKNNMTNALQNRKEEVTYTNVYHFKNYDSYLIEDLN